MMTLYCRVENNIIKQIQYLSSSIDGWLPLPDGKEVGDYYDDSLVVVDYNVIKKLRLEGAKVENDLEVYILASLYSQEIYDNIIGMFAATYAYTKGDIVVRNVNGTKRAFVHSVEADTDISYPERPNSNWIPVPKIVGGLRVMMQGDNAKMYIEKYETVYAPDMYTTYRNMGDSGVYSLSDIAENYSARGAAESQWVLGKQECEESIKPEEE